MPAIDWQTIMTNQGTHARTAPDPEHPGQYLYAGSDDRVYRDPYSGEVQAGDVGKDYTGLNMSQLLKQYGSTLNGQAAPAGGSGAAVAASPLQPTYLSQLFPNGLPQQQTATLGNLPQIDPSEMTSQIMSALGPQFSQQNQAMIESLANAGIVGGSTTGAMGSLAAQQQQQALGQIAPMILSALQSNQGTALQGGEFNAGARNAGSQFDISNLIKGGEFDISNQAQQADYLAGLQNQDWLEQLGLQGNLISSGAGAQSSAFQPIFQQPSTPNYTGLASSFAPSSTPQPQPYQGWSGPYAGTQLA